MENPPTPPATPPIPPMGKQDNSALLDPRIAADLVLIEAEALMIQMGLSPSKAAPGAPMRDVSPLGAF